MNSAVGYTVLCFLFVPFVGVISIWGEWHSHQPQPKGEWRRGKKRQVANLFGIVTGLLRTAGIDCCLPETRQCCSKLFDVWNAVWIFLPPSLWSPRRSQHLQMRQSFHGRCSRPHPRHSTSDENEIHTACCTYSLLPLCPRHPAKVRVNKESAGWQSLRCQRGFRTTLKATVILRLFSVKARTCYVQL